MKKHWNQDIRNWLRPERLRGQFEEIYRTLRPERGAKQGIVAKRRRRMLQKQIVMTVIFVILLIALALTYNSRAAERKKALEAARIAGQAEDVSDSTAEQMEASRVAARRETETPKQRLKRVRREAVKNNYPADIIDLLRKNKETVGFVEDFMKKKDLPASAVISKKLKKGKIPQVLQWDERWGYAPYGSGFVATCGCGPTALSMVVAGLTGDASVTPAVMAAYSDRQGFIDEENNTYWALMTEGAKAWGVSPRVGSTDEEYVKNELKAGHPIICSVGPGDFTEIGHFIVLTKYKNGKVKVNDPFSKKNSKKKWVYADIRDQIKSLWVYEMKE